MFKETRENTTGIRPGDHGFFKEVSCLKRQNLFVKQHSDFAWQQYASNKLVHAKYKFYRSN